MVNKIEIIANGQVIDLRSGEDAGISIKASVYDITNLTKRSGAFSYTISLPKTKNNLKVFKHADIVKAVKPFQRYETLEGIIKANGVQILIGKIKLLSISESDIKISIISNQIAWTDLIKDKKLVDLQSLRPVNFIGAKDLYPAYSPSNSIGQENIWTGDSSTYDIQFPLVSYGNMPLRQYIATGFTTSPRLLFRLSENHKFVDSQKVNIDGIDAYAKVISSNEFEAFVDYNLTTGYTTGTTTTHALATEFDIRTSTNSDKNVIHELNFDEIPPSFYIERIFKSIFSDIGYSVAGSFFDDSSIKNLLINYTGQKDPVWNWGTLARAEYQNIQSVYTNFVSVGTYNVDINGMWQIRARDVIYDFTENLNDDNYVCPTDGLYRFTISFSGSHTRSGSGIDPAIEMPVFLYRNNGSLTEEQITFNDVRDFYNNVIVSIEDKNVISYFSLNNQSATSPRVGSYGAPRANSLPNMSGTCSYTSGATSITGSFDVIMQTPWTNLSKSDFIKLYFTTDSDANDFFGLFLEPNIVVEFSGDTQLHPEKSLPDVRQIDFIKDIIKMFNLYIDVDDNNKIVYIESRDNFFKSNQFSLDWNNKIVSDKFNIKPINTNRELIFQYAIDEGDYYKNKFLPFIRRNETINASGSDSIEINNFSPTSDRIYLTPKYQNINIPTVASEETINQSQYEVLWNFNYKPRILKYEGLQEGYWVHDDEPKTSYPYATFENPTGITLTFSEDDGLFKTYYLNNIRLLEESFVVETDLNLSQNDISNLDFRLPVKINDTLFYITTVKNYKPADNQLTPVDLIKLV